LVCSVPTGVILDIYQTAIRPFLFSGVKADPEWLHQQSLRVLSGMGAEHPPARWMLTQLERSFRFKAGNLEQSLWGIKFPNPVGLAAGFDKDGVAAGIWGAMGFGFAEVGTVTFHPQPGNPRPRLFRLPKDKAALNRMGFNNQGSAALSERLKHQERSPDLRWGVNLGKSKLTPLSEAAADYVKSFRLLKDWGDYFVVNVSSPNTPGLRSLQDAHQLSLILDALQQENQEEKPILVKIAPDLTWKALDDLLDLAKTYQLAGIIATNTTISRDRLKTQFLEATGHPVTEEAGGISGVPLRDHATEVIRYIRKQTGGYLPIIGVGGIFKAEDAWEKITAGASLVQLYTGWIYQGPAMVRRILEGLSQRLEERGWDSIAEAVGTQNLEP
jgi:dihydroorotate dehydrogenase